MKIRPPEAVIDEKEPFKGALFGRKEFGESLVELTRKISDGLVIFVNAPWGGGKTTFARMWLAHLKNQKLEVIYFDAFASDYFDDPFVCFSGEILELFDRCFESDKGLLERREFKKTAMDVGKRLAGVGVKAVIQAATMGVVKATHIEELKEIGKEAGKGLSEIGADLIEEKIEHFTKEKDALKSFKASLSKLAAKLREQQDFPLTIIVDELDRCRPEFALKLLEPIKHLFDVEGVTFVLLVNREQIESYVRTVYGESVDAFSYLQKFADLFVDLPIRVAKDSAQHETGNYEFCGRLLQHHGLYEQVSNQEELRTGLIGLSDFFHLTCREIEKSVSILVLYYASVPNQRQASTFLVVMLSLLRVKRPGLYRKLSRSEISMDDFFRETNLDKVVSGNAGRLNSDWVKHVLMFFLMPELQFSAIRDNPEGPFNGFPLFRELAYWPLNGTERTDYLPFLCRRLDRFSVKP